ncbi:unnamed protein product [Ostreobium quekettii]|uniref:Uncharacterized protein n=1 Tax=Ostreobium quekettii TaxID=121088 RepID=A0A8S1J7Q2_9CHLO|nr:unnamed protein product [Ostreobium quekettii]|eukprot:evm.model.scf_128EXC.11 EVM.evm.TU.scf_128EXC.11   scf_128EXC:90668-95527(-)
MDVSGLPEQPVARAKEIFGLWVTSFGAGPMMSVIAIILQLLIVKQTKYLASTNEEWVEWRDKFDEDRKCEGGPARDDLHPYRRPEGMSEDCDWFPINKEVPGLGLDYSSIMLLGSAVILLLTGVLLVVFGPFGDFGHYRRQLLIVSFMISVPSFGVMSFIGDPHLYWLNSILAVLGAVSFFFALKAPFIAYLPLLIESHWKLFKLKKRHLKCRSRTPMLHAANSSEGRCDGSGDGLGDAKSQPYKCSIEMAEQDGHDPPVILVLQDTSDGVQKPQGDGNAEEALRSWNSGMLEKVNSDTRMLTQGLVKSDDAEVAGLSQDQRLKFMEEYHTLREAVASEVTLKETSFFLTGQVLGLLVQFGIIFSIGEDSNPKDTLGERGAIGAATIWLAFFSSMGISLLKTREGPPFPEGNRFLIGFVRSVKTLHLMQKRLGHLLCLMVGRMLVWLGSQTLITVFALFLEREFSLSTEAFGPLLLIYFVCGAISAMGTSLLLAKLPGYTLLFLKVSSVLLSALPIYIVAGVQVKAELYILMAVAAMIAAPFPSLVRAMMAHMIPEGYTATIMSFEGLLENATVWVGPVVVFLVLELSDSMRWAVFSLIFFMVAGLPFVFSVKMSHALEQRMAFQDWDRAGAPVTL